MNDIFRLVNPVYDMDTYICKVNVFTKQANTLIEYRIIFLVPRIQHVGSCAHK